MTNFVSRFVRILCKLALDWMCVCVIYYYSREWLSPLAVIILDDYLVADPPGHCRAYCWPLILMFYIVVLWYASNLHYTVPIRCVYRTVLIDVICSIMYDKTDWLPTQDKCEYNVYCKLNMKSVPVYLAQFMWWYVVARGWVPETSSQRWDRWWSGAIRQQAFAWTKNRPSYIVLLASLYLISCWPSLIALIFVCMCIIFTLPGNFHSDYDLWPS